MGIRKTLLYNILLYVLVNAYEVKKSALMIGIRLSLLFYLLIVFLPASVCAQIQVVVSVKPIHSLVASVMLGVGKPVLLLDGLTSPHTYTLKPSQAALLSRADIVFWLGQEIETFLKKPIENIVNKENAIELLQAPGLSKLPIRNIAAFANFNRPRHKKLIKKYAHDAHVWLDPKNAKAMVLTIVRILSRADHSNGPIYHANGLRTMEKLDSLSADIATLLSPIKYRRFVTFHDAFQYFERSYRLMSVGVITISPEVMPGADRVKKLIAKIKDTGTKCVFAEPQFNSKLMTSIINETSTRGEIADPLGSSFKAGADQYFLMMRKIAKTFHLCLSGNQSFLPRQ